MPADRRSAAAAGDVSRAWAIGAELVEIHHWLRTELTRLRDQLARVPAGTAGAPTPLRAHCTAFCTALARHHTSEDTVAFPRLAGQFPELVPVLRKLRQDHDFVADLLRRVDRLAASATADNVDLVRRELDGLAVILESHFRYEEKTLLDALDALDDPPPDEELFGLTAPDPGR